MTPEITTFILELIKIIVSLLIGGGGVFTFFQWKVKHKQEARASAIDEWKDLYDEMKERLEKTEQENEKLRNDMLTLKKELHNLSLELSNYKTYDKYINELEKYVDHILEGYKGLVNEDAYKNICSKRPIKKEVDKENNKLNANKK